jgi:two-component system OmpR family response regulator
MKALLEAYRKGLILPMVSAAKILVVDNDVKICRLLTLFLEGEGYAVRAASTAEEMRRLIVTNPPNLVIFDPMLKGEDGLELARELRSKSDVALIMLTGKTDVFDKVVGLEIGADDYITKPFDNRELLARARSVLRRNSRINGAATSRQPSVFHFAGWTLDLPAYKLTSPTGEQIALTCSEFHLLSALVRQHDQILSREAILDLVAGRDWSPIDRSVDVLVGRLRKKIEDDPTNPVFIKTIRGVGYKFTGKVSHQSRGLTRTVKGW